MIDKIIEIARKASDEILKVYDKADLGLEYKADNSPLTEADKKSHDVIVRELTRFMPEVPVISEESTVASYEERSTWDEFWLVDPLDGTKEFIKRNGEFTVNIGLIKNGVPILGVISIPVRGDIYYGIIGEGAYGILGNEKVSIRARKEKDGICAAVSRSHLSPGDEKIIESLKAKTIVAGSALKFTLVAEGEADVYSRFGPTWEWDTAAGHAIAQSAGAVVLGIDGKPLRYNKEVLKHEGFIVVTPSVKDRVFAVINNKV